MGSRFCSIGSHPLIIPYEPDQEISKTVCTDSMMHVRAALPISLTMGFPEIDLRPTTPADLDFVLAAESDPENAPYVGQWSRQQHLEQMAQTPEGHQIVLQAAERQSIGFAIFMGIKDVHRSIQLKRLVITIKGKGYGRATLERCKQLVFDQWQAHRFWLDVKDYNQRARYLYRSCGFVEEGILRECFRPGGSYETLILMSILEQEYRSGRLSL